MKQSDGFTLIELLVTIAIAAVLLVVAVPSLVEFRRNAALSDAVGNFIGAAQSARAAALKTGRDAYLQAADTGTGWQSGWVVFVDNNWNEALDEASDEIVIRQEALGTDIVVGTPGTSTLANGYIRYAGNGFPRSKASPSVSVSGTVTMETTARKVNIVLEPAGRLRSCRVGDTGC